MSMLISMLPEMKPSSTGKYFVKTKDDKKVTAIYDVVMKRWYTPSGMVLDDQIKFWYNDYEPVSAKDLGGLLLSINNLDGTEHDARVIYFEKDLLPILKAIGLPEPEWGESINVEDFIKSRE